MADANLCLTGTAWTVIRAGTPVGTAPNIIDNDTTTAHVVGTGAAPLATALLDYDDGVDFDSATISKVELVHMASGFIGNIGAAKLYLYYTGGYNEVLDVGSGLWAKTLFTTTGEWADVTKIKLTVSGGCGGAPAPATIASYDYELRAWGSAISYTDKGVRFTIAGTNVAIGAEDLDDGTHTLRYETTGTTVGIPLVATNDANACGIRFYDGASVQSVPKLDL